MTEKPRHFVLSISSHDIALAIMAGAIGLKAPENANAEAELRRAAASEPEMVAGFYRSARNVMVLLETEMNRAKH